MLWIGAIFFGFSFLVMVLFVNAIMSTREGFFACVLFSSFSLFSSLICGGMASGFLAAEELSGTFSLMLFLAVVGFCYFVSRFIKKRYGERVLDIFES